MTDITARPIPVLPPDLLGQYNCAVQTDTRYRAAARLAQALWREAHGHPCGRAPNGHTGRLRKLGSLLASTVARTGANIVDPALVPLVRQQSAYCEFGAAIDAERLWGNLLSSQALTFSMFGPLKQDAELATRVLSPLFPDVVGVVEDVIFEHSPGRSDATYTGDRTAFDVLVRCTTPNGGRGFLAIEVKYTEAPGGTALPSTPRMDELSRTAGVFTDPDSPALRGGAIAQFWRQQLLATAMVERGLYDEGRVVVIAPTANRECWNAISQFASHHASTDPRDARFEAISLERFIDALGCGGGDAIASRLSDRYTNLEPVHTALAAHWVAG